MKLGIKILILSVFQIIHFKVFSQTGYGYQKRTPDSYVDYSAAAKDITNSLEDALHEREQKKVQLDQNTYDCINTISSKTIVGGHSSLNYLTDLLQDIAISELKRYNKMLKNGTIHPNDFSTINFGCLSQYNLAINKCYQLLYKLDGLQKNSERYRAANSKILDYLNYNSKISFNTELIPRKRYYQVGVQEYKIVVNSNNYNNGTRELSITSFVNELNNLIDAQ